MCYPERFLLGVEHGDLLEFCRELLFSPLFLLHREHFCPILLSALSDLVVQLEAGRLSRTCAAWLYLLERKMVAKYLHIGEGQLVEILPCQMEVFVVLFRKRTGVK